MKSGVLVAIKVSLVVAIVAGILIILGWCYKKKSCCSVKGKIHISVPVLIKKKFFVLLY